MRALKRETGLTGFSGLKDFAFRFTDDLGVNNTRDFPKKEILFILPIL
jgi:hypothetical protein